MDEKNPQRDNLGRYLKGRTFEHTEKTKAKIGRANSKPNFSIRGEKSYAWKGEAAGYTAKHAWVKRYYGSPSKCEDCGGKTEKRYEWANISGKYLRLKSDWKRLCKKCHISFDGSNVKGEKTHFAKLTRFQVQRIRLMKEIMGRKLSIVKISKMFGITPSSVARIVNRQNWKHI